MLPEAVCGMLNLGTGHQLDPTCVFGAGGLEIALQKGVQTRPFFEWCGILLFCIGCCSVCVDTALARPVERYQQDCLSVAVSDSLTVDVGHRMYRCGGFSLARPAERGVFFQRCPALRWAVGPVPLGQFKQGPTALSCKDMKVLRSLSEQHLRSRSAGRSSILPRAQLVHIARTDHTKFPRQQCSEQPIFVTSTYDAIRIAPMHPAQIRSGSL